MLHVPVLSSQSLLEPAPTRWHLGIVFNEDVHDLVGTLSFYETALYSRCTSLITKIGLLNIKIASNKNWNILDHHNVTTLCLEQDVCMESFRTSLIQNFGTAIMTRIIFVTEDWQLCEAAEFDHSIPLPEYTEGSISDMIYAMSLSL